jgi:8-oxo-dGTP pyrophosphatase MutT (NUDIX family)
LNSQFVYKQSSVIPYRITEGILEILLITSISGKRWIIPKGFIEFNMTAFESAKKEAYEEAGVIGSNETISLGEYSIEKFDGLYNVKVFTMEVSEVFDQFPEDKLRKRKWFTFEEALSAINIKELVEILRKFHGYLNK